MTPRRSTLAALVVLALAVVTGAPAAATGGEPGATSTLTQTIGVTVAGAEMSVDGPAVVPAVVVGDRALAVIGPVTVVDARGTLAGWSLSVTVRGVRTVLDPHDLTAASVRVVPLRPHPVYGRAVGLAAAPPTTVDLGEPARLGRARAGDGGGTYTAVALAVVELAPGPATGPLVMMELHHTAH